MPATEEELKKAFKAFKKRVKLTQLNDDSRLGRNPLTEDSSSLVMIPVERTMVGGRWVYES